MVALLTFILATLETVTKKVYFSSNILKNSARCTDFVNHLALKFNDDFDDKNNRNTNKNDNGSRI